MKKGFLTYFPKWIAVIEIMLHFLKKWKNKKNTMRKELKKNTPEKISPKISIKLSIAPFVIESNPSCKKIKEIALFKIELLDSSVGEG